MTPTMTATPGRLVCLEGIDGAGKTTTVRALGDLLTGQGMAVAVLDRYSFPTDYLGRHLSALRRLIWEHPPDDPYLELGDMHWVHLQAAWYQAMSHCVVRPLVEAGTLVLADTWAYKFQAKLALRPTVHPAHVRAAFDVVPRPDLVVGLRLDPAVAAGRKQVIAASEAGNHEGAVPLTPEAFAAYQRRLARELERFGEANGWAWVDVTSMTVPEAAAAVAVTVASRLFATQPDALPGQSGRGAQ